MLDGKWEINRHERFRPDLMAHPDFTPDVVYLSASSGASVMFYDNEWWIVYGDAIPGQDPPDSAYCSA